MSLKAQAVSGVKWSGLSTGIVTTLHFVTLAILARLLSPSDFGLMGMIMVVIGFAHAFADMGLSNAIIQRKEVPKCHLSTFFWMNVLSGVLIFVCIILISPFVVLFFKKSDLSDYLMIAGFIFLITPIGQIFTTILKKELKFKILSKIEITCMAVYSVTSIGLAIAQFGVLSLILAQLFRSLTTVCILIFLFRKEWLPSFHFNILEIRSYISFGVYQMGERAVNYLSANIDYIIIGRFLGPAALGFYTLAYQIMIVPLTKINTIITKVAFPAFSKVKDNNVRMRNGYCKTINYISFLTFPLLAGMFLIAPDFIRTVYGEKWEPTVILLQILCFVGIFKSLGNPIGSILLAKGRVDIGFYWNVFVVIMVSLTVSICVRWGIVGVAVAILILQFPFFLIIQPVVNRLINLRFFQYLKSLVSPVLCTFFMVIGIMILRLLLNNINMLSSLIITVVFGVILYFSCYYVKDKSFIIELKSLLLKEN